MSVQAQIPRPFYDMTRPVSISSQNRDEYENIRTHFDKNGGAPHQQQQNSKAISMYRGNSKTNMETHIYDDDHSIQHMASEGIHQISLIIDQSLNLIKIKCKMAIDEIAKFINTSNISKEKIIEKISELHNKAEECSNSFGKVIESVEQKNKKLDEMNKNSSDTMTKLENENNEANNNIAKLYDMNYKCIENVGRLRSSLQVAEELQNTIDAKIEKLKANDLQLDKMLSGNSEEINKLIVNYNAKYSSVKSQFNKIVEFDAELKTLANFKNQQLKSLKYDISNNKMAIDMQMDYVKGSMGNQSSVYERMEAAGAAAAAAAASQQLPDQHFLSGGRPPQQKPHSQSGDGLSSSSSSPSVVSGQRHGNGNHNDEAEEKETS